MKKKPQMWNKTKVYITGAHFLSANKEHAISCLSCNCQLKVLLTNEVTTNFPLRLHAHFPQVPSENDMKDETMDLDGSEDLFNISKQTEFECCIKRQISNSSDASDDDCSKRCQRKTRRLKVKRRPTRSRQVILPSRKHRSEEESSDDDNPVYSNTTNNTTSVCGKKVLGTKDMSLSSNESKSGSADLPHACTNETTTVVCFPSFQDTDNEQLSTFAADSDCSDEREINPALVNEEAEDETCISLLSNSSSSNGEEFNSCDNLSGNDSSSSESDENYFLSDSEGHCKNFFTKSIYEGSNLSVGASCILIMQFSRKYKLPCKAQSDLLTLIKLHCPEEVEIALPQTCKELLKKIIPSLANVTKVRVCSICTKKIEEGAIECENGHPVGRPTKEDSYFIEVPLEPRVAGQLIYDSPARQNCNLFHGNGGNSMPSESSPVMADQHLTRSLSEVVSPAISETVSAVLAQVSI